MCVVVARCEDAEPRRVCGLTTELERSDSSQDLISPHSNHVLQYIKPQKVNIYERTVARESTHDLIQYT